MKKSLLSLLFLFFACTPLQKVPAEQLTMTEVAEVDLGKDELFKKSLEWAVQTFVDSKEAVELKDRENGTIMGKGLTSFTAGGLATIPCRFTFKIEIKEKKIRTTFMNFVALWAKGDNPMLLTYQENFDKVKPKIVVLRSSLVNYLKTPSDQDW